MIRPGLLMWIFKDDGIFYIRFLHLFGIGCQKVNDNILNGIVLLIGIWKFEIGIHLGKRRGEYVKRNENETSPTASA
jgi:hypothetical protein